MYHAAMRDIVLAIAVILALPQTALAQESKEAPVAPAVQVVKRPPADIRADLLDSLFARLHAASSTEDTKTTEQAIWDLWMASDSPTAEVLLKQATRAMDDGAPEQALSILNRLIGAQPEFAEAWNKRATLYFLMGRYDDSLQDIDKVLELEPRHFGALSGRGMIYQRQQKYSQARAAFEEALAMNPAMEQVRNSMKMLDKLERGI